MGNEPVRSVDLLGLLKRKPIHVGYAVVKNKRMKIMATEEVSWWSGRREVPGSRHYVSATGPDLKYFKKDRWGCWVVLGWYERQDVMQQQLSENLKRTNAKMEKVVYPTYLAALAIATSPLWLPVAYEGVMLRAGDVMNIALNHPEIASGAAGLFPTPPTTPEAIGVAVIQDLIKRTYEKLSEPEHSK